MCLVRRTKDFDKSVERIKRSGRLTDKIQDDLIEAVELLASGKNLPRQYEDHQLKGDLLMYREPYSG